MYYKYVYLRIYRYLRYLFAMNKSEYIIFSRGFLGIFLSRMKLQT